MQIEIDKNKTSGFNAQAIAKLEKSVDEYVDDLISEASRIEAASRSSHSGPPEVTSSMVENARVLLRTGLGRPRKGVRLKLLRVGATVAGLIAGLLYDSEDLQDGTHMAAFIVVVSLAILLTTLSVFKED